MVVETELSGRVLCVIKQVEKLLLYTEGIPGFQLHPGSCCTLLTGAVLTARALEIVLPR